MAHLKPLWERWTIPLVVINNINIPVENVNYSSNILDVRTNNLFVPEDSM